MAPHRNDDPPANAPPAEAADAAGDDGLSSAEAGRRLLRDGPNLLPQSIRRPWWKVLASVLREPMLVLLMAAAVVYMLLGDPKEAAALAVSVLLVLALTLYQELRSVRALEALRDLSSPRATVVRDGRAVVVPAAELVSGDLIQVAEGDRVPADARVLRETGLTLDESLLTGESVPVRRTAGQARSDDAEDHLKAGSLVVGGHGRARVVATGAATEMGRLGLALRDIRPAPTPMQLDIRRAVVVFAGLGLCSAALVVALYVRLHGVWLEALLAGITIAIANIPEEFPVVLAVFLALGAWRMARHQALVRRPPAIEALGSVTVLCTDKTGTLTENRMRVAELVDPAGDRVAVGSTSGASRALLQVADRASPADLHDPMERAIRDAATALPPPGTPPAWVRVREYPLTPELLATTHVWRRPDDVPASFDVACKGAPEAVVGLCALADGQRDRALASAAAMAARGLRVLAVARASWTGDPADLPAAPQGYRFEYLGLLGLADPLREGVPEAVAEARAAGIRVVMLTGDHPATAVAIATQAGLDGAEAVAGGRLDALDDAAFARCVATHDVFARVQPQQKLRLVRTLAGSGEVVAMTGDGVNDAPALMAAHVGVAMGRRGTDVAREAAAIVLLDDNFVTVIRAIRQGRVIYDNIERAVRYILAVHVPITGLALLPLLLGDPLVLLPLHVVFLEMIIDPASTIVFEREPAAADVMRRPPRRPDVHLLNRANLVRSLGLGLVALLAVIAVYLYGRSLGLPPPQLAALSFTALVGGNLGLLLVTRGGGLRALLEGRRNPAFWIVAGGALSMLAVVVGIEGAATWFGFSQPPPALAAMALLLPWALLWVAGALARRRPRPPVTRNAGAEGPV